jgi:hypothetical protein
MHDLSVVTRNRTESTATQVAVLNPFSGLTEAVVSVE